MSEQGMAAVDWESERSYRALLAAAEKASTEHVKAIVTAYRLGWTREAADSERNAQVAAVRAWLKVSDAAEEKAARDLDSEVARAVAWHAQGGDCHE